MLLLVTLVLLAKVAIGQQICDNTGTERPDISLPPTPVWPDKSTMPDYKIFIYDLPSRFNTDLLKCSTLPSYCFDLKHHGMGEELYQDGPLSVRDTHQFSLEVLMHHKLMHSSRRTRDPSQADLFYIPFYSALTCFCRNNDYDQLEQLYGHLHSEWGTYFPTKPHFSILSKIEREQYSQFCPTLRHPDSNLVTWVGIEQEMMSNSRQYYNITGQLVVAPYPSYGHFIQEQNITTGTIYTWLYNNTRTVKVFMAAGERRSNPFRNLILEQFPTPTDATYHEHMLQRKAEGQVTDMVWLKTPECRGMHKNTTMTWMKQSIFCVQPSGDSPTRKSFYDAILSGCIPVIFKFKYKVKYPFSDVIDYSKFTVTIPEEDITAGKKVVDILNAVTTQQISDMQRHLAAVAPLLQYSYPPVTRGHYDAADMMLDEIAHKFLSKQFSAGDTKAMTENDDNTMDNSLNDSKENMDIELKTKAVSSHHQDSHEEL